MSADTFYRACGLMLKSNTPIAGLRPVAADGSCDLTVTMREDEEMARRDNPDERAEWYTSPERDPSGVQFLRVWLDTEGYVFRYSEGVSFRIDPAGRRVDVHWAPPLIEADAATYLLGPVIAFVLRLRGMVPLHAGAVAVHDRAVLFVGEAGAGKSSTVATFATLGYPVIADDIVPVVLAGDRILAWSSYPRVSVWPDSAEALLTGLDLRRHSHAYPKPFLDVLDAGFAFQQAPLPVEVVYVLGDRSSQLTPPCGRSMSATAALLSLVRHTYGSYLLDAPMRAFEFEVLSHVAGRVPVRDLSFGDRLDCLPAACRSLIQDSQTAMVG